MPSLLDKWKLMIAISSDPAVGPAGVEVTLKMLERANSKTMLINPSYATIAADCGISRDTAIRAVAALEDAGWLRVQRGSALTSNSFEFAFEKLSEPAANSDHPQSQIAASDANFAATPAANSDHPQSQIADFASRKIRPKSSEIKSTESKSSVLIHCTNPAPRSSSSATGDVEEEYPSAEDEAETIAGTTAPLDGELFPPGVDTNLLTNSDSARGREIAPGGSARRKPPAYTSAEIERMFSAFWFQYPKKEGRGGAKKAFERIVKSRKVMPDVIMNGAMRYAAAKTDTDPQFIKGAARWLNEECWTDETPAPRAAGTAPRRNSSSDDMMRAFLNLRDGEIQ